MKNLMNANKPVFREIDIKVGKHQVSARVAGEGPPLVLFHSLLADSSSFDPIAELLVARHQVVVLNLPGFGSSDLVEGGLEGVADILGSALRAMALDRLPIFIGNGYGGFVALLVAIRHPGIAARLVLADCGAAFSEPGRAAFRNMSTAAAQGGLAAVADVAMRRLFSPQFQTEHPALIAERRERFLAVDPQTFHNACAALAELDLRDRLSSVTVPVLVLVGEHDEATPPVMSEELASMLPDARLRVISGCAHVPQLQEPERFMAEIKDFITM
jgi:3-oxoadipate enol-lactonase